MCRSCPTGSSAPAGSTYCTCNAGFTGPNGGPCTACPAGAYAASGASTVTCSGSCPCPSTAGASGSITDGPGQYDDDASCAWVISNEEAGSISISFSSFSTEKGYDSVRLDSCESSSDQVSCESSIELARLTGTSTGQVPPSVVGTWTSTTGHLRVTFTSDGSVREDGFVGEWFLGCSLCPAGKISCMSLAHQILPLYIGVVAGCERKCCLTFSQEWKTET